MIKSTVVLLHGVHLVVHGVGEYPGGQFVAMVGDQHAQQRERDLPLGREGVEGQSVRMNFSTESNAEIPLPAVNPLHYALPDFIESVVAFNPDHPGFTAEQIGEGTAVTVRDLLEGLQTNLDRTVLVSADGRPTHADAGGQVGLGVSASPSRLSDSQADFFVDAHPIPLPPSRF